MSTDWSSPLDIYCERVAEGLAAEPLNALSNVGFLFAAYLAYRLWKRSPARSWDMLIFVLLIGLVGIGSLTFHTVATRWAGLADVIPIAIYIHFGLGVFLYRVMSTKLPLSIAGALLYLGFGLILQRSMPPGFMFGSGQYAPALLLLFLMSGATYAKGVATANYFAAAFLLFAVSLTFRSLDMPLCDRLPIGLHYLWHLLNAVLMYVVYAGIIRTPPCPLLCERSNASQP